MKSRLVPSALWVIPVLLLAACGGGGGGSSPPPTTASQLVVTDGNAQAVAAEVLQVSTNIGAANSAGAVLTGVEIDTGGATNAVTLSNIARQIVASAPTSPAMATGVTGSRTCQGGGTLVVTDTSASPTVATAGDKLEVVATNCTDPLFGGTPTTVNGSMSIAVASGSFDPKSTVFPKHVVLSLVANNFAVTQSGVTNTSNGDLTIDITESSSTDSVLALSATSLTNTVTRSGVAHSVKLTGYSHIVSVTSTQASVQVSASVESVNSRIGSGTFSYSLSTPSAIIITSAGYVSGSLKVTGSSSGLLLTVVPANNFTLQVDRNGDGAYDATTTVTRTQLEALI
jgi:hypothetical protein